MFRPLRSRGGESIKQSSRSSIEKGYDRRSCWRQLNSLEKQVKHTQSKSKYPNYSLQAYQNERTHQGYVFPSAHHVSDLFFCFRMRRRTSHCRSKVPYIFRRPRKGMGAISTQIYKEFAGMYRLPGQAALKYLRPIPYSWQQLNGRKLLIIHMGSYTSITSQ